MSASLDLVRSIYADWERGDFSSAEWADPEIEFLAADGPDPFTVTGVADMGAAWRKFLSTWDKLRLEAQAYREVDDERVLVYARSSGRGKMSGMDLGQVWTKGATIFHVRDGHVVTFIAYTDRNRAFADLGLEQ